MDFKGYLNVGAGVDNQGHTGGEPVYNTSFLEILRARLDYTITITENIETRIELTGDIDKSAVGIRKGYVRFKLDDADELKTGVMKKRFSYEEIYSEDELITINRSLENIIFNSFRILGHDMGIEYGKHFMINGKKRLSTFVNTSADGDRHVFGNGSLSYESSAFNMLLSGLYSYHRDYADAIGVTAGTEFRSLPVFIQAESFGGRDPNATDLLKLTGVNRNVYFAGARALGAPYFRFNRKIYGLEPLLETVLLFPDLRLISRPQVQNTAGINIYFSEKRNVRWMTDGVFIFTRDGHGLITTQSKAVYTQLQVSW